MGAFVSLAPTRQARRRQPRAQGPQRAAKPDTNSTTRDRKPAKIGNSREVAGRIDSEDPAPARHTGPPNVYSPVVMLPRRTHSRHRRHHAAPLEPRTRGHHRRPCGHRRHLSTGPPRRPAALRPALAGHRRTPGPAGAAAALGAARAARAGTDTTERGPRPSDALCNRQAAAAHSFTRRPHTRRGRTPGRFVTPLRALSRPAAARPVRARRERRSHTCPLLRTRFRPPSGAPQPSLPSGPGAPLRPPPGCALPEPRDGPRNGP
jgi:hypothetical protein